MVSPILLQEQRGKARGRSYDALDAHAGLGESKMQRVVESARPAFHKRRSGRAPRLPWRSR